MSEKSPPVADLEARLNDLDPAVRAQALQKLLSLAERGLIPTEPQSQVANMHCHSFFSHNGYGYSPTALAWVAKKRGIGLMGIVDFDVLDGVDEFLEACQSAGIRASAGIETRVRIPEFATQEINSPGEPGIGYHMGIGFTTGQVTEKATRVLQSLKERAGQRNRGMVRRVNAYLDPVTIDYEKDVLSLTPCGNPTERHMVAAYVQAAEQIAPTLPAYRNTDSPVAAFWAEKLDQDSSQIQDSLADVPGFHNLVREKLMKHDGVGYVQPDTKAFPTVEEFHELVLACEALPCAAWLDGTSEGEQNVEELLDLLIGKGVVALNIIPDRNWNIADPEQRRVKVENLYEVVCIAQRYDLPLNVGTEMNRYGQKMVDDFDAPELAQARQAFIDGAYFIYGHTAMQRAVGLGYQSEWAQNHLPTRSQRNRFYTQIGYQVSPGKRGIEQLRQFQTGEGKDLSPQAILAGLRK